MKNILIIPPFNPYPLVSGGHQAIYNGIAILKNIANVYLLVDCTESQYKRCEHECINEALPWVKVIPFILPEYKHTLGWYIKVLRNKVRAKFPQKRKESVQSTDRNIISNFTIKDMRVDKKDFVIQCITKYNIDIVQVEMCDVMEVVTCLPSTIKKVFVHHELHFVRNYLFLMQDNNATEQMWNVLKSEKQKEINYLNQYDVVITLSDVDTQKLKEAGVTSTIVTSYAVVKPTSNNINRSDFVIKKICFVGPESHYPNSDGVMWFLGNCWEKLLSIDKEWEFDIIGKWTKETAKKIEEDYANVKCVGFMNDLGSAVNGTTMIVPIRIGSGMRMKILEAAQLNVPVVTTTAGVEGLPLLNGEHCYIVDDANMFVENILNLQDPQIREKFVRAANKLICEKYSIEALIKNRRYIYD